MRSSAQTFYRTDTGIFLGLIHIEIKEKKFKLYKTDWFALDVKMCVFFLSCGLFLYQ